MALSRLPLSEVNNEDLLKKIGTLEASFVANFRCLPEFYVKCPGRVNLIGEHLDYNKFNVLPIAIDLFALIAASPSSNGINIFNCDKKYPSVSLPFSEVPDKADTKDFKWYSYILAGISIVAKTYGLNPSMNILVMGNIPAAAGLSSSSALVCAAAIATVYQFNLHNTHNVGKKDIAELCAVGETYVGTRGGGMDQAIILFGQKGFASKINFHPELKVENVHLPREIKFIIAHSGLKFEKATTNEFNKRVAECVLGIKMFSNSCGFEWRQINNLWDLLKLAHWDTIDEMGEDFQDFYMESSYTLREISQMLQTDVEEVKNMIGCISEFPLEEEYKCKLRLTHIFSEVRNVKQFLRACKQNDMELLGNAMNESHRSLKENYNCSHPKLDTMVNIAIENGALGARLTGAGWGGCIVAAVKHENVNAVESALKDFLKDSSESKESVFTVSPGEGACVIENRLGVSETIVVE